MWGGLDHESAPPSPEDPADRDSPSYGFMGETRENRLTIRRILIKLWPFYHGSSG